MWILRFEPTGTHRQTANRSGYAVCTPLGRTLTARSSRAKSAGQHLFQRFVRFETAPIAPAHSTARTAPGPTRRTLPMESR